MFVRSTMARFSWRSLLWVVLLPLTPVAGAKGLLVQEIGNVPRSTAGVFGPEVALVRFSTGMDPRTTPILVGPGTVFVTRNEDPFNGLSASEAGAIELAYEAGQPIVLLDANMNDVDALHRLVGDGVAIESNTDSLVLAYVLRKENDIPTGRLVTNPVKNNLNDNRTREERNDDMRAVREALDLVVGELTRPLSTPVVANSQDWKNNPVQSTIITSTDRGTYNTPVTIYALHSCQQNKDYYLVNTGGTWTPTAARYQSASKNEKTLRTIGNTNDLEIDWQDNDRNCTGGIDVYKGFPGGHDSRICRYMNYPLSYEVGILAPTGPTVVQVNSAPAGDQGKSANYTSGFSFSIFGGVNVASKGTGGGLQAGVTWDNSVSTTVPPLIVEAGNAGNQGTFTRYKYCTIGTTDRDCQPRIQMTDEQGVCRNYIVGRPQNGQTPNGRLSNVAQTVNWQVDPGTYGDTFDITVNFSAELTTSTSRLWMGFYSTKGNPKGNCNGLGCSCGIDSQTNSLRESFTFRVPRPSNRCSP